MKYEENTLKSDRSNYLLISFLCSQYSLFVYEWEKCLILLWLCASAPAFVYTQSCLDSAGKGQRSNLDCAGGFVWIESQINTRRMRPQSSHWRFALYNVGQINWRLGWLKWFWEMVFFCATWPARPEQAIPSWLYIITMFYTADAYFGFKQTYMTFIWVS